VANGKVYLATFSNRLDVYGLLPKTALDGGVPDVAVTEGPTCSPPIDPGPPQPTTWSYVFTSYFGPGTIGHCAGCHNGQIPQATQQFLSGTTAESFYQGMVAANLINVASPKDSNIGDPCGASPLSWFFPFGGSMPFDAPTNQANPRAAAAVYNWVQAGAVDDCKNGCPSVCPPQLVNCGIACVDLTSDAAHCGSCTMACPAGQACQASKCIVPNNGPCQSQADCNAVCSQCQAGTCVPVTGADDPDSCTGTKTCNAGGTCVDKQPLGAACTNASDCASGFCVDQVCCNEACTAACKSCRLDPLHAGTCSSVTNAPDPDTCTYMNRCDASGMCASRITNFTIPSTTGVLRDITTGPDGNLWFTEGTPGQKIGRITPTGVIAEFDVSSGPSGIAAGPDGNLWFTEDGAGRIGRLTPAGAVTEFALPATQATPGGIVAGADGNLWFAEALANKIGRITPAGVITEFAIPTATSHPGGTPKDTTLPTALALGSDHNVWFVETWADQIGRVTPNGVITEFAIPTVDSFLYGIAAGPDGALWFTENQGNKIGRISTAGVVSEFPAAVNAAVGILAGPDGNLWFGEGAGSIVTMSPAGSVLVRYNSTAAIPDRFAVGSDQNLWYTQQGNGMIIGRFLP
jgi:streptogramin lyase